jgi:hypothetical protein
MQYPCLFCDDNETLPVESLRGDEATTSITRPRATRLLLFRKVKTSLKGKIFQDIEDMRTNVTAKLNLDAFDYFCAALNLWPWSWTFTVFHAIYVK